MKQIITIDDLNKLSDDHKERLREWWNPQTFDVFVTPKEDSPLSVLWIENDTIHLYLEGKRHFEKADCLPLPSIGQMITFIEEKKPMLKGISKNRFNKWFVNIDNGMLGYKDELCDALWDTVKQILKQP